MIAGAVFVLVLVSELSLPCRVWRYPVGVGGIAFSLFALAVVGTQQTRPEISDLARNATVFFGACGVIGAAGALFGALC